MEDVVLHAARRVNVGKGHARKLRQAGKIPGVLYGPGEEPIPLSIETKELERLIRLGKSHGIISLVLNGEEGTDRKAIIREIQYHPVNGGFLHVDVQHISLKHKVVVEVPVVLTGDSVGVREGGVLEQILHSVEVECLPVDIPEKIEVDISHLHVGDSLHVRDLMAIEDRVVTEPDRSVVTIIPPTVVKKREVEEVAEPEEAEEETEAES